MSVRTVVSAIYQQTALSKMPKYQERATWEDEAELFRNIIHKGPGSFLGGKLAGKENMSEAEKLLESLDESLKSLSHFITDMGSVSRCKDPDTAQTRYVIPRYGAWEINSRGVKVLEAHEDLDYLKKKYRTERVFRVEDIT